MKTSKLEIASSRELGLREASAVIPLTSGRFLVADDERGIYLVGDGLFERVARARKDVEGICWNPGSRQVYAVSESSRRVSRAQLRGRGREVSLVEWAKLGKLPKLTGKRNSGWEGIDLLPGVACSDRRPRLVAVHQRPERVGIFGLRDASTEAVLELPSSLQGELDGLNDVGVCPRTHRVFVLSGKSHRIATLRLERSEDSGDWRLSGERLFSFAKVKDDRAEGLGFDTAGGLWMVTDGKGHLESLAL